MLVLFHIILEIPLLSFTHSAHAHRMCPFRMTQRAPCALFLNAPLPLFQAAGNPMICVFTWCTLIFLVLSCRGSYLFSEFIGFYMSLVTRKPVFLVCDQGRLKPACTFVIHIWHKQVFSWCGSYQCWKIQVKKRTLKHTLRGWKSYLTQCWNPLPLTFMDVMTRELPRKLAE